MISRRRFLQAAASVSGVGLGNFFYTWRCEPHWVEIVERGLPVANLPGALRGSRLAQLSDLHIGPRVDDSHLLRAFDHVKDLIPDLVVYTGDFTSYSESVYTTPLVFSPNCLSEKEPHSGFWEIMTMVQTGRIRRWRIKSRRSPLPQA